VRSHKSFFFEKQIPQVFDDSHQSSARRQCRPTGAHGLHQHEPTGCTFPPSGRGKGDVRAGAVAMAGSRGGAHGRDDMHMRPVIVGPATLRRRVPNCCCGRDHTEATCRSTCFEFEPSESRVLLVRAFFLCLRRASTDTNVPTTASSLHLPSDIHAPPRCDRTYVLPTNPVELLRPTAVYYIPT
jgi:hypothetical protein